MFYYQVLIDRYMRKKKTETNFLSSATILLISVIVILVAFLQQAKIKKQQAENTKEIKKAVREAINESLIK